ASMPLWIVLGGVMTIVTCAWAAPAKRTARERPRRPRCRSEAGRRERVVMAVVGLSRWLGVVMKRMDERELELELERSGTGEGAAGAAGEKEPRELQERKSRGSGRKGGAAAAA